jgi:hypothetical protein
MLRVGERHDHLGVPRPCPCAFAEGAGDCLPGDSIRRVIAP